MMSARTRAAATLIQLIANIEARRLERGGQSKKNSGENREAGRERKHGRIEPDALSARHACHCEVQEGIEAERGEREAERASGEREQDAFGKQLADDPSATCAERCADRDRKS